MKAKMMILCAIFAALIAVGAFVEINVFIIPITLQTFFVILAGLVLGAKWGPMSVLVYVVLGLLGLPVFTKGGGIFYIFELTFGFILGFILCAFIIGLLCGRMKSEKFFPCFLSCVLGILCLYLAGVPYALAIKTLYLRQNVNILPFIWSLAGIYLVKDIIICAICAYIGIKIKPALKRFI